MHLLTPTVLLLLFATLQTVAATGGVYQGRARQLDVAIPRADTAVVVDGNLDEPVWRRAALLTGFSEYRPTDGRAADDSTQVLVWYASDAIYFGIRAFEAHGSVVRATLANRDNIDADDRVQIILDTYDDHRRAMLFAVNPLGVQEDGIWTDGGGGGAGGQRAGGGGAGGRFDATVDLNPDFVYQSRGHVTSWGYEVEVRVPFKSLTFQSSTRQNWGLQIDRVVQHSGHEDTWTPAVRANASFLIQSGTLVGLTDLQRGLVMDLTPEFTTKVNGSPRTAGYHYGSSGALGGTLRWGVTPNMSAVATAHPDFSQVEADVGQVTANQRFALFFPEKRPFFLEGLDQYDTPNTLIYTRRIVQPVAGAKLTGKVGGFTLAYLGAVDATDDTTGKNPVYNVLRMKRDLGASSSTGLVLTDREDGSQYNRVAGTDARVVWRKLWFSQVQIVGSWTQDAAGTRAGELWDAVLADRTGRAYGNHTEFTGISPNFEALSGFVNRTGIVKGMLSQRWSWYGARGALLEQLTTFLNGNPIWRYDDFARFGGTLEGGYSNSWNATLRGGWSVNASVNNDMQRFDSSAYVGYHEVEGADTVAFVMPHGLYNLLSWSAGVTTPNRPLTATATVGGGATPIFAEASRGHQTSISAELTWHPTALFRLDALWTHQTIDRARDGSRFITANIPRLEVDYQLTRSIFFRYIGQYTAQDQAAPEDPRTGAPIVLDPVAAAQAGAAVTHDFRSDFLFSYRPVPGTVFLFGYGATLSEPNAFQFRNLTRESDGFFLKASYLFRM